MSDLIKALQIFLKYGDPQWPTHCEHDVLSIAEIGKVSPEDTAALEALGFLWDESEDSWISFRFGSA